MSGLWGTQCWGLAGEAFQGRWLEVQAAPGPKSREGSGGWAPQTPLSARRTSAARVGQLQEALDERHSIISALKAK